MSAIRAKFLKMIPLEKRPFVKLVFEVDVSEAKKAIDLLGFSEPGVDNWCAIAKLTPEAVKKFPMEHAEEENENSNHTA